MATVPFEARLNIETLATLDRWYRESGHAPRTRSDLIYMAVEDMCAMLIASGKTRRFESLGEAVDYFTAVYGGVGKPGRGERTMLAMRRAETLAAEGFSAEYLRPTTKAKLSDEELKAEIERATARIKSSVDTLT